MQRTRRERKLKTRMKASVTKKEKLVFPLNPTPPPPAQGRYPVRGSEFHENEPQSLHRLIQISQLHIPESLPHPSQPQPQVPTLCPPLCLLAQNRGSKLRLPGEYAVFSPIPPLDREWGSQAQSGRAEIKIRRWFFPHSTSLPSSPGQQTQGVWLQGDFKIPQISKFPRPCQREGGRELCSG